MSADHAGDPEAGDLAELVRRAKKTANAVARSAGDSLAIAFFDLTGSTSHTLAHGNTLASERSITFTTLAGDVSRLFGGELVKTLGDGALVAFSDALAACRAALRLRHAALEADIEMTAGLTVGRPTRIEMGDGRYDLLGDVVNRAARVQSMASPGQVLIDQALYTHIQGDIAGERSWQVDSSPRRRYAKGIGVLDVYEVCMPEYWKLKEQLATPFSFDPSGRPSLEEKIALLANARAEIIEIGAGLTSFARYFAGQKPGEFRDPVRAHVRRGVRVRCFTLDPEYEPGIAWLEEQKTPNYLEQARDARETLLGEARYYKRENYRGGLHYYTYRRIPEFWCLGVDIDDEVEGRMFYAPYLLDVPRAQNPVVCVSRSSDPHLFGLYLSTVKTLRQASSENEA